MLRLRITKLDSGGYEIFVYQFGIKIGDFLEATDNIQDLINFSCRRENTEQGLKYFKSWVEVETYIKSKI